MREVFADTFYFIALTNPRDTAHHHAVEFTTGFQGRIITTSWVLSEFGNYMSHPVNRAEFVSILADLRANNSVHIISASEELFEAGVKLFGNRLDKHWSITDCISFVVMERNKVREALTGDHHFEQAGFVALLK